MNFSRLCTIVSVPFVVMSCCGRPVEGGDIGAGAQEILDSLSVENELAVLAIDQLEVANDQATPEGIAQALTDRINANRVGCATAALDPLIATQLSISFACALGAGEQSVTLDGVVSVAVTVNNQLVSFTNNASALSINGVSTNDTTTITADLATNTNSFSRAVSFALSQEQVTLNANGSLLFDAIAKTLTVNAEYGVSLDAVAHTHQWDTVVLQEGLRLPSLGLITITDAQGGELKAAMGNLGGSFTLSATQGAESKEFNVQFPDAEPQLFDVCSPVETKSAAKRSAKLSSAQRGGYLSLGCIFRK